MGGNQSWLNCGDSTYPVAADGTSATESGDRLEIGDPIIAVFMFIGTLVGVLLLTAAVHCGIVAWRGWRRYWRHRQHHLRHRHQHQHQQPHMNSVGDVEAAAAAGHGHPKVVIADVEENVVADAVDRQDVDGESSISSITSTTTSSSDTSLDSTTARIAAQVANRRRSQYIIELAAGSVGVGGVASAQSRSPTPTQGLSPPRQEHPPAVEIGVGGDSFLRPPTMDGGGPHGYVNRAAYD